MPSRASFSPRERQLRSRLRLLLNNADGFIHGSLIEMARKCGHPSCRCASDDALKHRSLYLGQSRGGKKSMVYLPDELVPEVRQAVDSFQQALSLLEELNAEARTRLDQRKASRKSVRMKAKIPKKVRNPTAPKKKTPRGPS